jgi:rhodanese-related sulfurtransferase
MQLSRTLWSIFSFAGLFLLPSCDWLGGSKAPKFVIVNVLDKEAFDDCHIKGSINVPFMELKKYALDHWDKDVTEIVVHCSNYSCGASSEGYTMLTKLGFKHVWAFEGGTAEAKQFGIPVVGSCQQVYLQRYEKPEFYVEKKNIAVISVEELKKKIEEFAIQ